MRLNINVLNLEQWKSGPTVGYVFEQTQMQLFVDKKLLFREKN